MTYLVREFKRYLSFTNNPYVYHLFTYTEGSLHRITATSISNLFNNTSIVTDVITVDFDIWFATLAVNPSRELLAQADSLEELVTNHPELLI